MRVTLQARRAHDQAHQHTGSENSDVLAWIAYWDEEDNVARAVCPELSLIVERPDVRAAAKELDALVADYIVDAVGRGESRDDMLRLLPRDIIATNVTRLTRMLQLRPEEQGTAWLVGHCHVSHAKISATAP